MNLSDIKEFLNVYYDDDDKYIELIKNVVIEEFKERISSFQENNMTSRQKLILLLKIQDIYDNRSMYEKNIGKMRTNVSSMLLNEFYKG
ncbi:head-tail connector protein [Clostridium baratii]|uniref:head-tail connector protein n=1 Tax=Clostridium baratii TaxID=1561 RepID=UPI0030D32C77